MTNRICPMIGYPKNQRNYCFLLILMVFAVGCSKAVTKPESRQNPITKGSKVSLEYTLKLQDGNVIDTNVGGQPLIVTQGDKKIVPGLEQALVGMKKGESKSVTVTPEVGYGNVNPKAVQEISKERLPPEALKVGAQLQATDNSGRVVRPRVAEIKQDTVVLDFNHPLAGQTLYFDIKVLDVESGTAGNN